ncbi:MAG: hypothetical protein ACLS3C_02385 [Oscillospiraceae bacterium]
MEIIMFGSSLSFNPLYYRVKGLSSGKPQFTSNSFCATIIKASVWRERGMTKDLTRGNALEAYFTVCAADHGGKPFAAAL